MKPRLRRIAVVILLLAAPLAAAEESSHVRARLVTDSVRLEPGVPVRVGVLLEMEPGWHVYWLNPGDAGLATVVELELPDGLEAAELQWPAPVRFEQPGGLTAYGYEGSVLLAAEVRAVGDLPDPPTLAVRASWLACRDVCVLGSAALAESWPLPLDEEAFERWRTGLPGGDPPFGLSTTGGPAAGVREGTLSVWLQWAAAPGDVSFFPMPGDDLKISEVSVLSRGALTRVDLEVRMLGDRLPPTIAAVVTESTAEGGRRSWQVSVPLAPQSRLTSKGDGT